MKPQITRRTALNRIATAMLVASALSATAAHAASFQYRHPVVGLVISPTAQAQQVVTEILMALTGGPALPAGEVNLAYSYDLKQLLSVTGDSAYSASGVAWSLPSGALPAGLSLGSDGVISGIPTTKDAVGSSFQVKAAYKTKTGQQAYTIVVGGAVLHVTQISTGWNHSCALTTAGEVKCWGRNNEGQLGDTSVVSRNVPVSVVGLTNVTHVSANGYSSCALTGSGGVFCWGSNSSGQIGDNSTTNRQRPTPVRTLGTGVASITTGSTHACAVKTSGEAVCWGNNYYGQLGNGGNVNQLQPAGVYGLDSGVTSIAAGESHTCAVVSGAAKCWGFNSTGQLGDNSTNNRGLPVPVVSLGSGVLSLALGSGHSCASLSSGAALCWGMNSNGQLGDNSLTLRLIPTPVNGLSGGVTRLAAGYYSTCAVTELGSLKCWGYNGYGQLGDGTTIQRAIATLVLEPSSVSDVSMGMSHTCAITANGPKCWGRNFYGQLGNGGTTNSSVPVDVSP